MDAPSIEHCMTLLREREVPLHIQSHSIRVAQVAGLLFKALKQAGAGISLRLLVAGALLHDIAKMEAIRTGGDHAEMGALYLEGMGMAQVAQVVRSHVRLDLFSMEEISEAMVVNYADKRVMHTEVVSLDRRFEDILDRYGSDAGRRERITGLHAQAREMEGLLLREAGMEPVDVMVVNTLPVEASTIVVDPLDL